MKPLNIDVLNNCSVNVLKGTLKTRDWKTWDQTARVEIAGLENAWTRFAGVENAGQPSMKREMLTYA